MTTTHAEQLRILFRRKGTLPCLNETVTCLIKEIDAGESSMIRLEKIIRRDPAFAILLQRFATNGRPDLPETEDLRQTIMSLGLKSVRAIATSILCKNLLNTTTALNNEQKEAMSEGAVAVGFFAKYLYSRWLAKNPGARAEITPPEVFSMGVLSELGVAILAHVDLGAFNRAVHFAKRAGLSMNDAVRQLYESSLNSLTCETYQVWEFPDATLKILSNLDTPWENEEQFAVTSCVAYAQLLARKAGAGFEDWPVKVSIPPDLDFEVGIGEAEFEKIRGPILGFVERFVADEAA